MKNISVALQTFRRTNPALNWADLFTICPGIQQNYFVWSQDTEQSAWLQAANGSASAPVVTPDAVVAPDGSMTADKWAYPDSTGGHTPAVFQNAIGNTPVANRTMSLSIWLRADAPVSLTAYFQQTGGSNISAVLSLTTNWQRFVVTGTFAPGALNLQYVGVFYLTNVAATNVYAWGAQLEMRPSAGPYNMTLGNPLNPIIGAFQSPIFANSSDVDITYNGVTYYASKNGAWQRGTLTSEAGFDFRGNDVSLTVSIPEGGAGFPTLQSTGVSYMAAATLGLFDNAIVQMLTAFWPLGMNDAASINAFLATYGVETKFAGSIKPAGKITRSSIEFEVADPLFLLNLKMPRVVIQASCRHMLFDPNCTLIANNFAVANSVASGSTRQALNLGSAVAAAPFYAQGFLVMTSGFNAGMVFQIKSQSSTTAILLSNAMPLPLAVGDTFVMYPGCDKTIVTCTNKFNNLIHIGAQPFVPNPEAAL